ncbi:hypothetical protein [Nocardia sp. NPDC049707]|uniref:hypothetical protein n=1 Tax=Nocardia sp. NPDC049707 TaxID=3154735 RepID=UPI003428D849
MTGEHRNGRLPTWIYPVKLWNSSTDKPEPTARLKAATDPTMATSQSAFHANVPPERFPGGVYDMVALLAFPHRGRKVPVNRWSVL